MSQPKQPLNWTYVESRWSLGQVINGERGNSSARVVGSEDSHCLHLLLLQVSDYRTESCTPKRGQGRDVHGRAGSQGEPEDGSPSWAFLQSSALGFGVYEQLGFRTVERWECWVAADVGAT
jgi:hypothetical protein